MTKDRPTVLYKVTRWGLQPYGKTAWEEHYRYRMDEILDVTVVAPKSGKQLGAYWAALARVVENTDLWPNAKALSNALQIHLGYFHATRMLNGDEQRVPIGVSEMDRREFSEYLDRVKVVLGTEIIPGLDVERLFSEREFYVEGAMEELDDRI